MFKHFFIVKNNQSEVTPAYINAAATIKRRRRGNILMKNKTGRPLDNRMNRIRNTPAPTPRILAIILHQNIIDDGGESPQYTLTEYSS